MHILLSGAGKLTPHRLFTALWNGIKDPVVTLVNVFFHYTNAHLLHLVYIVGIYAFPVLLALLFGYRRRRVVVRRTIA